jgi:2-polyprenyl-6-methoxyphenol hydroxylase-like FAD-dependent oxidoreductase
MEVLVSGASIAGLATAHWLAQAGHRVTVIELAGAPRSGGIAVDVRGAALATADRMGVLELVKARQITANHTWQFVDQYGEETARWTVATDFYDSPDDVEILRDDLARILEDSLPSVVDVFFDVSVTALEQDGAGVTVRLSDGRHCRYDLVVGADGLHSNVRALAFGPEADYVHHLGSYVCILKDCTSVAPVSGTRIYNMPGRMVSLSGDGHRCNAMMAFRGDGLVYDFTDVASQRSLVAQAFRDEPGWHVPALIEECSSASGFYFDAVSQVRMQGWSRGRVVLVGDAGYGPSFFSGMGTSLALLGAESLATALTTTQDDPARAGEAYSDLMRADVAEAQSMALDGMDILFPASLDEITARNERMRAGWAR